MEEQQMTRHQRRLLKKQEQEKTQAKTQGGSSIKKGRVIGFLVLVVVVGAIVYGVGHTKNSTPTMTYTPGGIHWHAKIDMEVCGQIRTLPGPQDGSMVGPDDLHHHHGDGVWHIEGRIIDKNDIALGTFFDAMKIPFDKDKFFDKKNGDVCPGASGKPGQVKMFVNDKPSDEFRNYIPLPAEKADEDRIKVVFE